MSDEQNVSRRSFLQGGLATAMAMGMPAAVARAAQAAQDPQAAAAEAAKAAKDAAPVRVAWIGSGTQGWGQDMLALTRIPGVQIVAVCDIYEPNLKRGLERAGAGAEGYKDYRKMLERKDIDAVGIATPLYLHAPMAIAALEAGKHVYVEKMMAYTVEDGKKMVRTADRTGKILQVGHQRRYSVDYHHALDMVRKGYFGEITHIRAQWNRRNNWRRPLPNNDKSLERLVNWRLYKDYSRGLMAELGSHQIDVTNWYLGAAVAAAEAAKAKKTLDGPSEDLHPTAVVGIGGVDYWKDGREVYDNVQVIFEYPGGQKLCYQSIEMNSYDGDSEQFMGRKGTLIMTEQSGKSLMFREPGVEEIGFEKFSENKTKVGNKNAIVLDAGATTKQDKREKTAGQSLASTGTAGKTNWHLALEDWIDCIRTGRKPFCDGRVGLADTVCVIAANEAMEKGKRVEIDPSDFKA